tara:strand:+ start:382 stop:594 length:213 start_codon:yes stop_codon:yes gene_type:complete
MNNIKITYFENKIAELEKQLEQWKNKMYDCNDYKDINDARHEVYCIYLELDLAKTRLIECLKEQFKQSTI